MPFNCYWNFPLEMSWFMVREVFETAVEIYLNFAIVLDCFLNSNVKVLRQFGDSDLVFFTDHTGTSYT